MNKVFRRATLLQNASSNSASRQYFQFNYPHSFLGANNAFNNTPKVDQYPK